MSSYPFLDPVSPPLGAGCSSQCAASRSTQYLLSCAALVPQSN